MKLNIYMKEMKFTFHDSIHLCHLFSIKQGRLIQQTKAKCTSSCFLLFQIEATHHKPYKQLLQESFFLHCVCYRCNLPGFPTGVENMGGALQNFIGEGLSQSMRGAWRP